MRIGAELWEFANRYSPIYERPPEATRWSAPLAGTKAAGYVPWMVSERVNTREPLKLMTVGHPSVVIRREETDGPTLQEVRLRTTHPELLEALDLAPLEALAAKWLDFMEAMSQGPYDAAALRKMGHPYGYEGNPPARWRNVGKMRGYGQVFRQGWSAERVKGFVPPLSVINRDSGELQGSWYWTRARTAEGVTLTFGNRAAYAFFLAHGTVKMQAHGPWNEAQQRYLEPIQQEWRKAVRRAQATQAAMAAQFGEESE